MEQIYRRVTTFVLVIITSVDFGHSNYAHWWTYDLLSGPFYWSLNPDWKICSNGKFQSPINIDPNDLLFDPGLKPINILGSRVTAGVQNEGNDVTLNITNSMKYSVNISSGPLSYIYTVKYIKLHFGGSNNYGTEHTFNKRKFDAEIQIMAYNSDIYSNFTVAEKSPRGLAIVSVFAKVKQSTIHEEFDKITSNTDFIQYRDDSFNISKLFIQRLIPSLDDYITYDGSLTQPPCFETVTWILLNKPMYIGQNQIDALRTIRVHSPTNPQAYMYDNIRPTLKINRRPVRTNINLNNNCAIKKRINYKADRSSRPVHS